MADQSRVFIGLLRPPKLMGLPIMYAMVWLFCRATNKVRRRDKQDETMRWVHGVGRA